MTLWTFLAVVSIASMFFAYMGEKNKGNAKAKKLNSDLAEMQDELAKLRKRVEHLEAIAVADGESRQKPFEGYEEDPSEENRKQVAQMARRMRS